MMQFKYPGIFYLLIVLIIPLIIHLFNLQKFKKIAFSNVQFLKKVKLESRKSSKIKKFIILALRIISFLALLFTFSQPYYSDKKINESIHNFIYLDNSMSLNTNDQNGNKLNEAIQEIIQFAPKKETYSLLTNDEFLSNISKEEVNIYLKKLNFSTKNSYFGDKIRTLESKINNETNELNKIILITDFQQFNKNKNFKFTNVNTPLYLKKPDLKKKNNISIDSVFIKTNDRKGNLISVVIKNQGEEKTDIPIALFNASNLLNKQSFSIKKDRKKTIEFPVESLEKIKGKIEITYNDVFLLKSITDTINLNKSVFPFEKLEMLQLGDIESSFAIFQKEYIASQLNKELQPFKVDKNANSIEAIQLRERLSLLESQKTINQGELELQKSDFNRYEILHKKGVIASQELEKQKLIYLQAQKNYKSLLSSISQLKSSLNDLSRNTKSTEINETKETINLERNVLQSFYQLKKAIKEIFKILFINNLNI